MGLRRSRRWCCGAGCPVFWLLLCIFGLCARAVEAQDPAAAVQAAVQPGTLSGVVTDSSGAVVAGAPVVMAAYGSTPARTTMTDGDGEFSFSGLPAGTVTLTVSSDGLATGTVSGILHAGETLELPAVVLAMASANTNVDVVLAPSEVAQIEVKEEEKQRIAGVYPNFFVTYNWHAAPLSKKQKFELAWRTTIDPVNFAFVGALAGIAQAQNDFVGYGQGAQGYGKRYGAEYADFAIGTALGGAVFPVLLHQDPRFFYKSSGSVVSRALYALSTAVITRGDNGKWQPNYSSVLGDLAAGGLSNLYYPSTDRNGFGLTVKNGLVDAAFDGVGNLIQEFILNRMTPGIPKSAKP